MTQDLDTPATTQPNASGGTDSVQRTEDTIDRERAIEALVSLQFDATDFYARWQDWASTNWNEYFSATSSNPRLGFGDSDLAGIAANVAGNLATGVVLRNAIDEAKGRTAATAAKLLKAAPKPWVGGAIGFVIGVALESCVSAAVESWTSKGDVDEAAADAAERAGSLIREKDRQLSFKSHTARADVAMLMENARRRVWDATSQEDVDFIADWAGAEMAAMVDVPPNGDLSLFETLRKEWVLEHAGDEEDANSETSEEQWSRAAGEAFGTDGHLDNHAEVFAYQTRGEWAKAGLEGGEIIREIIADVNRITADGGYDASERAFSKYHGTNYELAISDFNKLNEYLGFEAGHVYEVGQASCTLNLSDWDGACYVDDWTFYLNDVRLRTPDGGVEYRRHLHRHASPDG